MVETLQLGCEQLAAAGAGIGLASAWTLSKTALPSLRDISRAGKAAGRLVYVVQPQYDKASDKVAARLGVCALIASAVLTSLGAAGAAAASSVQNAEVIGYVRKSGDVVASGDWTSPSLPNAVGVLAVTALLLALSLCAFRLWQWPMLRKELRRLSYLWDGEPREKADIALLYQFADIAGRIPDGLSGSETDCRQVANSVFGVSDGEMRSTPVGQIHPRSGQVGLAGDLKSD